MLRLILNISLFIDLRFIILLFYCKMSHVAIRVSDFFVFHVCLCYAAKGGNQKGNERVKLHLRDFGSHCWSGGAISITYSECVFVALGIQHAMRMRRVVIGDLSRFYNLFSHCLISSKAFEKKNIYGT